MAFIYESEVRVRYADTDRMDYVYYGKYAEYFEIGRTELIRALGISYKEIEARGILLPVSEYTVRYMKPARYDEVLKIRSVLPQKPQARFVVESEIYNPAGELVATGKVVLAFIDIATNRPTRCPKYILEAVDAAWETD
jgi:acyl-CoA thioester hydrolase